MAAQLSHLVFGVSDIPRWTSFLTDVLGLVDAGDGRFRMDGRAWRIRIEEGPDDLMEVGWEIPGRPAERTVDPAGVPLAINMGPPAGDDEFVSPIVRKGFVGDDLGLGHLVVTAPNPPISRAFYDEMGFRLSDRIKTEIYGFPVDLSFFHINPRHHSLAFGGPQRKRLHHFMIEARSMDEVGLAYDRAIRAGMRITQTLGRHPNDRMFSFYAKTPSGFDFEFGWGGREVDDATWEPTTYDHISEWGHHPPQVVFARKK
jgi:2,3-dihydroxybiphenyl 1,2-dioxygenase